MQNIINSSPISKLSEIKQRFNIFTQITNESIDVHTTRSKEELIAVILGVDAYKQGRYITLNTNKIFVEPIAQVMSKWQKSVSMCISKSAKVIKDDIFF